MNTELTRRPSRIRGSKKGWLLKFAWAMLSWNMLQALAREQGMAQLGVLPMGAYVVAYMAVLSAWARQVFTDQPFLQRIKRAIGYASLCILFPDGLALAAMLASGTAGAGTSVLIAPFALMEIGKTAILGVVIPALYEAYRQGWHRRIFSLPTPPPAYAAPFDREEKPQAETPGIANEYSAPQEIDMPQKGDSAWISWGAGALLCIATFAYIFWPAKPKPVSNVATSVYVSAPAAPAAPFVMRPEEEFRQGHILRYRTKGHPKALGLDFQISYPASWRAEEGERPHIVQKFISQNGHGLEAITLMVREILPEGSTYTAQEIDKLFSPQSLRGMLPPDATYITAQPIVMDLHKGSVVIYEMTRQRVDRKMTMRVAQFTAIRGNKAISILCTVSMPPDNQSLLAERFKGFWPLFRLVANSFIIQEQYK